MKSEEAPEETKQARLLRILKYIAAAYFLLAALFFIFQRQILFNPLPGPLPAPASVNLGMMKPVTVTTRDGLNLVAWFVPPKTADKPVVAVFHGNAGTIAHRTGIALAMIDRGYGVFLQEYRGFSGNPGHPSEEGLYKDARAALQWLKDKGYDRERLVIYGESIGTGVAVQMAAEAGPKYLILQSPFTSIVDVAQGHFPVFPASLIVLDRFSSIDKIGKVTSPLLVIHGDADTVVPLPLGRKLFAAANEPKTFIPVPGGGHNDLYARGAGDGVGGWLDRQEAEERARPQQDTETGDINIFHPEVGVIGGTPEEHNMPYMKVVPVTTQDGLELQAWFTPPKSKENEIVVYFHGNAGDILQGARVALDFPARGYGVMLCEYRGYSGNPGTPNEEGFYNDGRACIKWLQDKGYDADRMVFYGWSLGSAVVLKLAGETPPARLVLSGTFTRAHEVFRRFYPEMSDAAFTAALKDTFDNTGKVGKITSPVLFLHGGLDGIVPIALAKELFKLAPEPKTFIVLPEAEHNDMFARGVNDAVLEWLEKQPDKQ